MTPVFFMPGAAPRPPISAMERADLGARVEMLERALLEATLDPHDVAPVVDVAGDAVTVNLPMGMKRVGRPPHLQVEPGQVVVLNGKSAIVAIIPKPPACGVLAKVLRVVDPVRRWATAQILGEPQERIIIYAGRAPEPDDEVLLDASSTVIVENLGPKRSDLEFGADTGVSWDDIGGQEDAKRQLREAIEEPITHAALYRRFGKKRVKGALLHGAPGCGKTLLFKAIATALAKLHTDGSSRAGGLISVKGPEVLSHWQGMSEASVRDLFTRAAAFHKKHGYPPVIAIDEADAILGKRGRKGVEGHEATIVPQFLAEMDGLDETQAFVILATNRPDVLDPAVVRPGRIDLKIEVTRPTRAAAAEIVGHALAGKPLAEGESSGSLGRFAAECIWAHAAPLYMIRATKGSDRRVTIKDFVSGALCIAVAEGATQLAIRRAKDGRDEGIGPALISEAVNEQCRALKGLDHEAELRGLVQSLPPGTVRTIDPVHDVKETSA